MPRCGTAYAMVHRLPSTSASSSSRGSGGISSEGGSRVCSRGTAVQQQRRQEQQQQQQQRRHRRHQRQLTRHITVKPKPSGSMLICITHSSVGQDLNRLSLADTVLVRLNSDN